MRREELAYMRCPACKAELAFSPCAGASELPGEGTLSCHGCRVDYELRSRSNLPLIAHLPYRDSAFDEVLHFGGINTFGEKRPAIAELLRVTKPGARIVIGDEGLAPWRENTRLGKWALKHNRLFANRPPVDLLPPQAGSPQVGWTWRGLFYVVKIMVPAEGC